VPWLTHHFKRVGAAVLISSLIWGFGHTGYDIFPMWFRGVEVTVLGVFLGWVYLRFGIITVVVAHFLFDVFWSVSGHVFGDSTVFHTVTCSIVLLLPLALAAIAHLLDRPDEEKPLRCFLNKYQLFNLGVLQIYIQQLLDDAVPEEQIRAELLRHNWDISVVESAFDHLSVNRASDGAD
jgi:hypothetical protein